MLSAVDAGMRPLKIPPRFVPYMEKHRIYELFYVSPFPSTMALPIYFYPKFLNVL